MPRVRRDSQPVTTDQPASSGAVPGQRDTQEGTSYPATQAETGQAPGRHAYGESAEYRTDARHRSYAMPGTLMILSGLLTFFIGITGIIRGTFFNTVTTYPFYYSVRSRGITLLVLGAAAFIVGLGLLLHMYRVRVIATVIAVLTAVANFMFLPYYPFWSVIVLALNVLIVWELTRDRGIRQYARLPDPLNFGGGQVADLATAHYVVRPILGSRTTHIVIPARHHRSM